MEGRRDGRGREGGRGIYSMENGTVYVYSY